MSETALVRTFDDVEGSLRELLGDTIGDVIVNPHGGGQLIVFAPPGRRPDVLRRLKDLGFTYYVFCGGVDWPEADAMEVYDQVGDPDSGRRVTVKFQLPRGEPRIPTASAVYWGSDWYERETWELFGIVFAGHPRLRRLFLPDWFEGYPMRKDYELPARVEKPWPGGFFEG